MMNYAGGLLTLMRPKQWIKNVFVLAPLLFSGSFLKIDLLISTGLAFILFCLASSATYILNDMRDVERDRLHAKKSKSRPLAAGVISMRSALVLMLALYLVLVVAFFFVPKLMFVILAYMLLNVAYAFVLKHEPVVDIFVIAIGFVLRVYAGGTALAVPISSWMFITVLCLALYLAAVKRRQELSLNGSEGRQVLEKYSVALVDRYAEISATGALIFYSMFVMSAHPEMIITVPLVLFGLFRYWYLVEQLEGGESPTDALVSDWQLMVTVVAWGVACALAIWPTAVTV